MPYPSPQWLVPAISALIPAPVPASAAEFNWDLLLKALGFVVTAAVAIVQVRNFQLSSRASLKTDLEILKLLDPGDSAYQNLKAVVDRRLARVYGQGQPGQPKTWTRVALGVFGLIWALAFSYWTFTLIRPDFSWWALLTGYLALAGLGWLFMGISGAGSRKSAPEATT